MGVDCTCSIDESDKSTWSEGRDFKYGSMTSYPFPSGRFFLISRMLYKLRIARLSVAFHVIIIVSAGIAQLLP
jgi:hypothetical protein